MAGYSLDDLLLNIGKAIKESVHKLDVFSLSSFLDSFEEDKGDNDQAITGIKPKVVRLPFPAADGSFTVREFPVVSLMHHSSLQLEDLRIKLQVTISNGDDGEAIRAEVGPLPKERPEEGEIRPNLAEIEVNFRRGDPPEGLARIIAEYNKQI